MLSSSPLSSPSVSDNQILNTDLASPNAIMMSSMFNERTSDIKDNLLKHSYDNPIFKTLIKNIKEGNTISAETAFNAICIDESNKVALGYALILSLECGQATNVGDLATHKWAENDLPRALLFMQTRASTVQTWNGPNRETIYKLLIDVLAKKTELTLEEKSKEHLKIALTYMINKWEDHFEILLNNHLIVQEVNLDDLLISAIKTGNSTAVLALVEKGAKNISDALLVVQEYKGLSRVWWKETNGYEIARRCLTGALALRPTLISVLDIDLENEKIKHIVNNILESKNITARMPELKTLLLQGNTIRAVLNLDQLLLKSLELWHGDAVIIIAKAGAKNLPQALYWLQEKYSALVSMVDGFYRTWGSGNWKDTYKSLTYLAAGNWQQIYDEAEKGYVVYSEVTQQNVKLNESDKEILQVCLQNMIRDNQDEAIILLQALNNAGLMRGNVPEEVRHKLIKYAIVQGNGSAVRLLVECKHLADQNEWCCFIDHLETLVSLSSITLWKPGYSYQELVGYISTLLVNVGVDFLDTPQQELLKKLFETIIVNGHEELLIKLLEYGDINKNIDRPTRQELFVHALSSGEMIIAKCLFEATPAFSNETLSFKLSALFYYQTHIAEINQKQPYERKIDPQFCRVLTIDTLQNKELFSIISNADEKMSLHNIMGYLINANAPELLQYMELQHVNAYLNYDILLDYAVKSNNFSFIQYITHRNVIYRIKKICILRMIVFAQTRMANISDRDAQGEFKKIRDYLMSLVLGGFMFVTNLEDYRSEITLRFSILEALVISGDTQQLSAYLREDSCMASEIDRLLEIATSYEPGIEQKKFAAIPILLEKTKNKIITSIERMQALPIEIKNSYTHIYTNILQMSMLHVEELLSSDVEKNRFTKIIINMLQQDANLQEDLIINVLQDTRIHTCLAGKLAEILPILKKPGYEQFLITLLRHTDTVQLNLIAQTKKDLIAPIFLAAARNNQHNLINFCLKMVTHKDDLGLYGKAQESPLVVALENNAVRVLEILLQLDNVTDMDTMVATNIEMTRRSANKQAWFIKPQPELSQPLLERLMWPGILPISQPLLS